MLQSMQQPSPTQQPSPAFSSFAGLLATLASPKPAAGEDESQWSSSDLGEDVASLSYERALRTHARYRSVSRDSGEWMPPAELGMAAAEAAIGTNVTGTATGAPKETAEDRALRSASVTIRLSKAECARLRDRAAEAGLTMSAYLRSCALEAEALRAQVKATLAELKSAAEATNNHATPRRAWFGWIGKLTKHNGVALKA